MLSKKKFSALRAHGEGKIYTSEFIPSYPRAKKYKNQKSSRDRAFFLLRGIHGAPLLEANAFFWPMHFDSFRSIFLA